MVFLLAQSHNYHSGKSMVSDKTLVPPNFSRRTGKEGRVKTRDYHFPLLKDTFAAVPNSEGCLDGV